MPFNPAADEVLASRPPLSRANPLSKRGRALPVDPYSAEFPFKAGEDGKQREAARKAYTASLTNLLQSGASSEGDLADTILARYRRTQ